MSTHRVKDISYNYDEHDDYADDNDDDGGEEELDAEDRELLRAGTAAVREELGADFPASEKEIQDALWHYYYDVGKSVAYLKNRKKPTRQPKQAKQKQASRFDNAANAAALKAQASNSNGTSTFSYGSTFLRNPLVAPLSVCMEKSYMDSSLSPQACARLDLSRYIKRSNLALCSDLSYRDSVTFARPLSASDYFRGISWRVDEIPTSQLSNMIPNPDYPRGRLLGGSSKPSKLAALAAARKKKEEEKRTEASSPESAQSDRVVALLDRLSVKKENESPLASSTKRAKFIPSRQKEQNQQATDASTEISSMEQVPTIAQQMPIPVADIRALPSMFAKAICKQPTVDESPITVMSRSSHRQQWSIAFSLPYIHNPSFIEMNPFAGPSPDDIVLQAQSKGSLAS